MSKKVVAVDCDDVLIGTVIPMLDHYNRLFGTNITLEQYYDFEPTLEIWGTNDRTERNQRINSFFDTVQHLELAPSQDVIEVLSRLQETCELHIITGRPEYVQTQTLAWLERHLPHVFETVNFTSLFYTNARSKAEVCAELGAQFLVDDHPDHCRAVSSIGVEALLFGDYPWNQETPASPKIRRVADWHEVERIINAAA